MMFLINSSDRNTCGLKLLSIPTITVNPTYSLDAIYVVNLEDIHTTCDTNVVAYQVTDQANWELAIS